MLGVLLGNGVMVSVRVGGGAVKVMVTITGVTEAVNVIDGVCVGRSVCVADGIVLGMAVLVCVIVGVLDGVYVWLGRNPTCVATMGVAVGVS
jgi:hypothetical protein